MAITRKGYWTVEKDNELLVKSDGKIRQAADILGCLDHIREDGRSGSFTIKPPDYEVSIAEATSTPSIEDSIDLTINITDDTIEFTGRDDIQSLSIDDVKSGTAKITYTSSEEKDMTINSISANLIRASGGTTIWLDNLPDPFTIPSKVDVPISQLVTSDPFTLLGTDFGSSGTISVDIGGYAINGQRPFVSAPGIWNHGDSFELEHMAAAGSITDEVQTVNISNTISTFTSTTELLIDTEPSVFIFNDIEVIPSTQNVESNAITVLNINSPTSVDISGGGLPEWEKNNSGTWNTGSGTADLDDTIIVRNDASGTNGAFIDTTLTLDGTVSDTFRITSVQEQQPGNWNLPSANYLPAYNPLYVTYPRTDTSGHARHFWAHSGFEYRIPIGVQGGAYPYKYEITSGPAGASIGETMDIDGEGVHTPGQYYGIIRWTPGLPERSVSFTVTITDQDGDSIQVTWSVEVDDSKFTFVDSKTGTSGVGTIGDPLKLWDDWYIAADDNTYQDNIIVFRGGGPRYQPFAVTENGSVCNGGYAGAYTELDAGHSICLIGYPDEMPVFDMQKCAIKSDGGFDRNCNGWFIGEIRFEDGNTGPSYGGGWSNTWCFRMRGHSRSACFFRNEFDNMQGGTDNRGSSGGPCSDSGDFNDNSDNSAVIWYEPSFNTGTDEGYNIYLMGNTFSNINKGGGNGSIWDVYYTQYMLVERNATTVGCSTTWGWWLKVHRANGCFRGNDIASGRGFVSGWGGMSHIFDTHPLGHQDNEWCYNRFGVGYSAGQWDIEFAWNSDGTNDFLHTNNALYRNTFVRGGLNLRDNTGGKPPFKVDANIIESNDTNYNNNVSDGDILETYPNLVALGTSTPKIYTNGTGVLVEPYRSGDIPGGWLGKVGHQIKG